MICVRDTEEFAETSHLQCVYPSFSVCCYDPHFTCIQNMDMARECISLILELMVMFLLFQMTLEFVHWSSSLGYPGEYFRHGSLIRYYSSQIFKATDSLQFLVYVMSVLMQLVLFVINWVFSALICMPYAVETSSR